MKYLSILFLFIFLFSCAENTDGSILGLNENPSTTKENETGTKAETSTEGTDGDAVLDSETPTTASSSASESVEGETSSETGEVSSSSEDLAGLLTAAEWSDITNWKAWTELEDERAKYNDFGLADLLPQQATLPKLEANSDLELMFIIDATGSMEDELSYIQTEIANVLKRVEQDAKTTSIRFSLVFYRDTGEDYLTKEFDFTENHSEQITALKEQIADGGGDMPEAVGDALIQASKMSWSSNTKKLAFLILDASPHSGTESEEKILSATKAFKEEGIQVFPVAASGIEKETEFFLRSLAIITEGSYIFLTDHSGVGGSHMEASVPDYVVEKFNELLIRVITEQVTGEEIAPVPYNQ